MDNSDYQETYADVEVYTETQEPLQMDNSDYQETYADVEVYTETQEPLQTEEELTSSSEYIDYTGYLTTINNNIVCGNVCLFVLCCIAIIVIIYRWIQSLF